MPAFLIAYDVAHPRRLRRVARVLERHGVRVQYSVFLFRGDEIALGAVLDAVRAVIRPDEDVVQAWALSPGAAPEHHALGAVRPAVSSSVIVAQSGPRFIRPSTPEKS